MRDSHLRLIIFKCRISQVIVTCSKCQLQRKSKDFRGTYGFIRQYRALKFLLKTLKIWNTLNIYALPALVLANKPLYSHNNC